MKKWKVMGSLFATMFIVSACSNDSEDVNNNKSENDSEETQSSGDNSEITLWGPLSGADGPFMSEIVSDFNDSQEEYTVDFQIVPQSEYYTTVDLALNDQSGLPDLMLMHGDMIPTYAEKGLLKDMNELMGDTVSLDDYNENAVEGATYNDVLYGVPLDIHPLMFYWNKDMFEEAGLDPDSPPTNREEFVEYAQALTDKDAGKYGYAVPTLWPQNFIFPTIVFQNGGELYKDGEILFDSPESIEALEFLDSLINEYEVSPADVQQDGEMTLFLQGNNAMHLNGPWMLQQWEDAGLNFGVAPVPMLGTEQEAVYGNSHNFSIPSVIEDDEVIEGTKAFLSYVAENGMAWADSGQAPASKAIYESDEFQEYTQQPEVAKQFDITRFSPEVENWGQLVDPLMEGVNEALLGQKDVQEALEEAKQRAEQRLDQ